MTDDILFQTKSDAKSNQLGIVILNRPKALNALNQEMFLQLRNQLNKWASDESIKSVLIKSTVEKAFCAGGDIRAIYDNKNKGSDVLVRYFQVEYGINSLIYHYSKPIIPLLRGVTMGGGVGISLPASHCVAAENLRWAMPETVIGFFPDVGATYYLSRLPSHIGRYLSLTGATINANDALQLNLIKAIVPAQHFDLLENKLAETIYTAKDGAIISSIIHDCEISTEHTHFPFEKNIAKCFEGETVEAIMTRLENHHSEWSQEIIKQFLLRSPTSLKVSLRQLHAAQNMSFDQVIKMDFHIAHIMLQHHDFYEGVRAAIIDKDKAPRWQPSELKNVSVRDVDQYFA